MTTACDFDRLLTQGIPHVHEKIFLSLDFKSFIYCLEVSRSWNKLLTSEHFLRKVKSVFSVEIGKELWQAPFSRNLNTIRVALSSLKIDINDKRYFGYYSVPLIGYPYGSQNSYLYGSPLHHAAIFRNVDVIKLFMKSGADPNLTIMNGLPPLCYSSWSGCKDVGQILLVGGADPNKADNYGNIPLHLATERGQADVVQLLLEYGAMPDMTDKKGLTALHWAIRANFKNGEMIHILLNSGANPNIEHDSGLTPIHEAANHGYKYLVQILLDEGVEPNIATGLGSTPLHCAVHYGWKEVVGLLLDRGAKPNMADVLGRTPLHTVYLKLE